MTGNDSRLDGAKMKTIVGGIPHQRVFLSLNHSHIENHARYPDTNKEVIDAKSEA